jgi:hypothetical protein
VISSTNTVKITSYRKGSEHRKSERQKSRSWLKIWKDQNLESLICLIFKFWRVVHPGLLLNLHFRNPHSKLPHKCSGQLLKKKKLRNINYTYLLPTQWFKDIDHLFDINLSDFKIFNLLIFMRSKVFLEKNHLLEIHLLENRYFSS